VAINPNPARKALHMLLCATTGGGKTTAIHQTAQLKKAHRVIILDPYNAYDRLGRKGIIKTYSLKEFAVMLHKLMNQRKPFVVSLVGVKGVKELDVFAKIIWQFADGNKELHVVIEELIRSIPSPNKLQESVKELWQGGRQFGLVMYSLFQRAQEVPKSIVNQSHYKWIGKQDSKRDAGYWSDEIDISVADIMALQDLQFYLKASGAAPKHGKLRKPV